jgi:hypothetical protein
MSAEPSHLASSVVTPQGYKASVVTPLQHTSSRMISYCSSASFSTAEKEREKQGKQINKELEFVVVLRGVVSLIPSIQWRRWVGLRQRSHKSTYEI